jgi:hypothetical protein
VVFIDTATGAQRAVDFGPGRAGVALARLDDETPLINGLDRSSASIQLWRMSYPQGEANRPPTTSSSISAPA